MSFNKIGISNMILWLYDYVGTKIAEVITKVRIVIFDRLEWKVYFTLT